MAVPASSHRRVGRLGAAGLALLAGLLLTACPEEGAGTRSDDDPRQTVPPQSPALDQRGQEGEEGVGPRGGPPPEQGD